MGDVILYMQTFCRQHFANNLLDLFRAHAFDPVAVVEQGGHCFFKLPEVGDELLADDQQDVAAQRASRVGDPADEIEEVGFFSVVPLIFLVPLPGPQGKQLFELVENEVNGGKYHVLQLRYGFDRVFCDDQALIGVTFNGFL